jgi:hypothetical protein
MRLNPWFMVLYDIGDRFSIGLALRIGLERAEYPLVIPVLGSHNKTNSSLMLAWREEGLDLHAGFSCAGIYRHVKRLIEKSRNDMT